MFRRNLTQFRYADGVPTGMDYRKAFRQAEAAGIVGEAWDDWLMRTERLEAAFMEGCHDRARAAREGR